MAPRSKELDEAAVFDRALTAAEIAGAIPSQWTLPPRSARGKLCP